MSGSRDACLGSLLLLTAACSSHDSPRDDADAHHADAAVQLPDSGSGDAGGLPDLSGAYLLVIDTPEPTSDAQLYLTRTSSGAYHAFLDGSECNVVADGDALTLHSCQLRPPPIAPNQFESRGAIYSSIRLTRNADGALAETISAKDPRSQQAGSGRLQASTRTPTLRARQAHPHWTARPALSWDVLSVDFGRGIAVDEGVARDKLSLSVGGSSATQVQWSYVPAFAVDDTQKVLFGARARLDFAAADGQTATFTLARDAADLAGREASEAQQLAVPLARAGAPTRGWSFDADSMPQATWGDPKRVQGSAECSGSCLQLGPRLTACGEPGMAGRLDTRDKARLVVRARAVLKSAVTLPVRLAVYLGAAEDGPVAAALDADLNDRTQPDTLTTEWRDLTIDLTPDQRRADLPFELRAIYQCPWSWTTTPTAAPSTDASVLIDAITLE